MDDWVGGVVALGIMAVLVYGVVGQVRETLQSNGHGGPDMKRNRLLSVSGIGFIAFYALNLLPALGVSSVPHHEATFVGCGISLIVYLFAKFGMKPKERSGKLV